MTRYTPPTESQISRMNKAQLREALENAIDEVRRRPVFVCIDENRELFDLRGDLRASPFSKPKRYDITAEWDGVRYHLTKTVIDSMEFLPDQYLQVSHVD